MKPLTRACRYILLTAVALIHMGCGAPLSPNPSVTPAPVVTRAALASPAALDQCQPSPVVVPTAPATVPGYAEYDPTTGLHMTGAVQQIDPQSYRLQVTGKVEHPLELTYDDLRCMPKITTDAPLICPGFFEDHAVWTGAPLAHVLALAGVQADARRLELTSADGYTMWIYLETALAGGSIIAYEWQGEPLPILHGFPVRAVFPSSSGSNWVKYLTRLDVN